MKIYHNDYDWYVAEDREHAIKLWQEWTGEDPADYDNDDWYELNEDAPLSIYYEDFFDMKSFPVPSVAQWKRRQETLIITAKVGDWAKVSKPGFLCSTEW